jgi:hypothetical protein
MARRSHSLAAALVSASLVLTPFSQALAGGMGNSYGGGYGDTGHGPTCKNAPTTYYHPVTINKNINIYKPVTINKDINIYKPVTINKDINITKNIDNSKNISIEKNININKSIVINKGGGSEAEAAAFAAAQAQSSSSAQANVVVYGGGGGGGETVVINHGGDFGAVQTEAACEMQEATVVKAIHAVCVSEEGREFPASHMVGETWIESAYEGEIARCIPGAHLKVVIGDVLQSDQGMAGTYQNGTVMECAEHEALRHFKDGMLKCTLAVPVPDCTERTNLRRYGTGDLFFSYRSRVCVTATRTARSEIEVTGMTMEGGVGESSN